MRKNIVSKYKVGVMTAEKTIEIRELELKHPGVGQVLVKVDSCAICTMEQRVYSGLMKYYPFAGGHEMAGTVEQIGEGVSGVMPGNHVTVRMLTACGECYYCRSGHENLCVVSFKASVHEGLNGPGGFAEYMLVDAKSVYRVADDLDFRYASLAEPLACCVHSVNKSQIELGNDVVVIGVGIMGAFHIQLAKLRGARVIACEVDAGRLEIAKKMGADVLVNSDAVDPVEKVKELTGGRGADVVFCTAALVDLASQAINMTGKVGRCVMYSSFHPKKPIELDVNNVHYSEMVITGSVNPTMQDFLTSTRLLSGGMIDPSLLISETVPFDKLDYAFLRAIDPKTYRIIVKIG
jgi:L-iditol 2-dehydrogenase